MSFKKNFLIIIGSLTFSFGILSVGYGFWTDKLDIEGKANVKFSVNVTDDVIEEVEATTPEAIELVVNPDLEGTENGVGDTSTQSEEAKDNVESDPTPEPPATDPTPEPPASDPGTEPPATDPTPEPPATDPTPEPPAADPTPEPPATDPTPEPPATDPTPEPPATPPASDPPADTGGNGETVNE